MKKRVEERREQEQRHGQRKEATKHRYIRFFWPKDPPNEGSNRKAKVTTRTDLKDFLKNSKPPENTASQPQQTRGRRPNKKIKKAKSQSPEKKKPPNEKTRTKGSEKNTKKNEDTKTDDKQENNEQDLMNNTQSDMQNNPSTITENNTENHKLSPEKSKNEIVTPAEDQGTNHGRDLLKDFDANKTELVQK